jgi:uncharacterized protein YneR
MKNYYYDVHVFFSRTDGYSIPVKTDQAMDDDDVIQFAADNDLYTDDGDQCHVDYVQEINEETYIALGGK